MKAAIRTNILIGCATLPVLISHIETVQFSNENLIINKPEETSIGNVASFFCEIPDYNQTITECQFMSPSGEVWTVTNGIITDESGGAVPGGYSAIDNNKPQHVCGIEISSTTGADLGDWRCMLSRSGGFTSVINGIVYLHESAYPEEHMRLPLHAIPIHYDLDLIVTLEPDFSIDGYFSILTTFHPQTEETSSITTHFADMSFIEPSLSIESSLSEALSIIDVTIDFERNFFTLQFEPPVLSDVFNATLSGKYRATLNDRSVGFYRDSYTDVSTGQPVWMAATEFEPADARLAFPCLDEPALKATFKVRLGHDGHLSSQSNGGLIRSGEAVNGYPGYIWDEFETSPVMSTYLVAFTVSDFSSVDSTPLSNGVQHTIWARYDAIDDGLAEHVRSIGPLIVQGYEEMFSMPYALQKLEQISPPNKESAMENWGLITYTETGLLIDVSTSSAMAEFFLVSLQTHEIAHQWFGNLVTCDWWGVLWLNEGFANYLSYFGSEYVAPQFNNYDLLIYEVFTALQADDTAQSHPITQDVADPRHADLFGHITYRKGASLLLMAEKFLTRDTFLKGITNYLNAKAYSTAVPDDLFHYLDQAGKEDQTLAADKSVKTIMDTWTLQKNFPLITVTRDYIAGTATLAQERFLSEPDATGDAHDYKWWIPITYTTVGDEFSNFDDTYNYNEWFPTDRTAVTVTTGGQDSPVIFNVQFTAYYRTNYDAENWRRLTSALDADPFSIHVSNRGQLLTDSYELAKAGVHSDYTTAMNIASYLVNETHFTPLAIAAYNLRDARGSSTSQAYADALFTSFATLYNHIGLNEYPGQTWHFNMAQMVVVEMACLYDHQPCVDDAIAVFADWMLTTDPDDLNANPVNRHVRSYVYCTAIRKGGAAEYAFLEERSANVRNPQERENINNALACTTDPGQFQSILLKILSSPSLFHEDELAKILSFNENFLPVLGKIYSVDAGMDRKVLFKEKALKIVLDVLNQDDSIESNVLLQMIASVS